MKINKKNWIILGSIAAIAVFGFSFKAFDYTLAEDKSISNLTKQISQKQQKIKELEKQAEAYRQIIDLKEKQQETLDNQIAIMDAQIQKVEIEIQINKDRIEELNSQIHDLEAGITEQEKLIEIQRKVLVELVRSYYENTQQNVLSAVFENNEFSRFIIREDQIIQIGDKVKDIMESLKSLRNNLLNEKKSKEDKKTELTDLYFSLEEKNSELQNNKDKKEMLITQTQGEEKKFRKLLDRVESQKQELLGDIDQLYGANSSAIDSLAATLPKPTSGTSSTSWYYSQKDKRWGSSRIGQSNSLVKDYGCALTSVAMIFTYYGESTTPGSLARQKIYSWDLIVWPDGKNVDLVKNSGHGGLKWSEVDRALAKGNPVIVFIKAKSNGAGHYVVIHHKAGGDYVVHDPYFGSNIYLSSSLKLLGALYKTSVTKSSVDQMILYGK
jgi:peptidoglycan hydrolase CwlO-like protein